MYEKSLKSVGSLFESVSSVSGARFKNLSSLDDMLGWQQKSFDLAFQIGADGISEYTMEQIKAKSAVMGLNDELTVQALALASDADFTAKASAKKITYKDAVDKYLDDNYEAIGEALKNNKKLKQSTVDALESAAQEGVNKYKETIRNVVNYTGDIADGIDLADDIVDIGSSAASATSGVTGLGAAFKGLAAGAKSLFATLATNPLTYFAAAAVGAIAFVNHQRKAFDEAKEQAQESQQSYSDAASQVTSLNSQLQDTNSQIEAIQSKGTLSITDQAELERLQRQSTELERQLDLAHQLADAKSTQAAEDAVDALEKTSTEDLATPLKVKDGPYSAERDAGYQYTDIVTATKNEIAELEELNKRRDSLMEKRSSSSKKEKENIDSQISDIEAQTEKLKDGLSSNISDLSSLRENFIDQTTGAVKSGYESYYNDITDLIDSYNMIDLSPIERKAQSLENFFSDTQASGIKSYLQELANSGASVGEIASAFDSLGISIDGVTSKEVGQYFKDMATAANEAADAAQKVDGSFAGVQAAMESDNQGAEWDAMSSNLQKALELYQNGLVGTDDFQTVAQWLSPTQIDEDQYKYDSDAYVAAWESAYKKVKNWFDSDNSLQSMYNFVDDLKDAGIANVVKDTTGSLIEMTPEFKSTAEAAKDLGVGVNSVEAAMHKLEEYGFEFDDVLFSGDALEEYKTSLDQIKQLYDEMGEGAGKSRLGDLIQGWDSQYDIFEKDLSKLTEDQIIHIKFEYDLASIQSQIDELRDQIAGGLEGDEANKAWANVIAQNNRYISTAKEGVGLSQQGIEIPATITNIDSSISELQKKMQKATGKQKIELQADIANLQELQKGVLNSFSDLHPEITAESDPSQVTAAWQDYFSKPQKIYVDAELDTQSIEDYLAKLQQGSTITFDATVDGQNSVVNATKNKNGQIVYSEVLDDGSSRALDAETQKDGTITFTADTSEAEKKAEKASKKDGEIKYNFETDVKGAERVEEISNSIMSTLLGIPEEKVVEIDSEDHLSDDLISLLSNLSGIPEEKLVEINAQDNGATDVIAEVLSQLSGIPSDVLTELLANDGISGTVSTVISGLTGIPESTVTELLATDSASGVASLVQSAIQNIPSSWLTRLSQSGGENVASTANQAKGSISSIPTSWSSLISQTGAESVQSAANQTASAVNSVPSSKTVTFTTIVKKVTQTISQAINNNPYAGKIHVNGTAHVDGTVNRNAGHAFASGNWGIERNETALVGELGPEILVRGSRYTTIGDRGAEFVNLKRGDIIFNSKQSEELLRNGYVTSGGGRAQVYLEGSSYAYGSAYANGGRLPVPGTGGYATAHKQPAYASSNSSKKSSSTNKSSGKSNVSSKSSKSSSSSKSSGSSSEDKFEEVMDYVEIYLKRSSELTNKLVDAIDAATTLAGKQEANSKVLSQISSEISANQQGYNKYISQANSVGLSDSYAKQVRDGSLNIETITDESLKEKIDDYQQWFDKAKDCEEQIVELQKQQRELALERLEYISDYYDKLVEVNSTLQDLNEERITYNDNIGSSATSDYVKQLLTSSVNAEQAKYNDLAKQLADYQKEFNSLMSQGYIAKGSDAYLEAQATVNEFNQEIIESSNSLIELQDQIRELDYTKLQQVIDALDRSAKRLENGTDYTESRGEDVSESDLQEQLDNSNKQIQANYDKRNALLKEQALYAVGSTRYQEIADQIADLDDSIYDALENIEDLKDRIWEVRWQPFFDGQEALSDLITETDDLRSLLNDDAFIGKNGGLTAEGITNVALISQSMNAAKQQIRDYQEALKKLNEDLENGNISTSEYEEQQKDFLSSIRDSVGVVEDYRDEIVDLYTQMLEKENDVMQSSIDKHKELLQAKKDNDDYSRNVKSQTKEINQIQSQISALSGINNESAKAELKRLQAQLAEAQDSLDQTRSDHEYEVREQGYEGLSEDLDQALQDTLDEVTYNADKQEQVISEMLNHVVNNYQTAYGKIQDIIANTGFTPSGGMSSNIDNLGTTSGAQDQVNDSNTIAPDYNPSGSVSDINTGTIQSGGAQSNNDNIENIISQEPNTTNRPVAELKLTTTSLSLQEGQSGSVKYSIRPTDAANKKLNWKSSNTAVATVSNGTVRAVKPGTATITAMTTDGSTLSASCGVTVTKKPDPPKPKPSNPNSNTNKKTGDGVPRIGDKVKFESGKYYYDSYGSRPVGSKHRGEYLYITYMNSKAPYSIHLGVKPQPGYYSDLGWVKLNQISGYKDGTLGVSEDQFAKINEMGKELIIRRGGSDHTWLQHGDGVVPSDLTKNLFTLGANTNTIMKSISNTGVGKTNQSMVVNNHYDSLLTVNGSVDKDALPGLQELLEKSYDYTMQQAYKDAGKIGIKKSI